MSAKAEKLVAMLAIVIIILSFTQVTIVFSGYTGGKIDLFTQKEPYAGKGPDMPSDAFGPGEVVILYALVTYDEAPVQKLLVTFHVRSPDNTSFSVAAETNESGIAMIDFMIPQKCVNESEVFGEWFMLANVLIGVCVYHDTLTFDVDWIVKLISVRTIDENLTYRTSFGIGGEIGLEIAIRSIAMSMRSTMLAIVIQDELNTAISYCEILSFKVPPNEKLVFVYSKLHIPKWGHVGEATVFVSALTAPADQGGIPYCPAVSANFFIAMYEPLTIAFHDVAIVDVVPSAMSVEMGEPLSISVVVRNEGTEVESFNVNTDCDDLPIGTLNVTSLSPYSEVTLEFTLNTSLLVPGDYTISVSIPKIANEADLTDNVLIDGVIQILPRLPMIIHDVAIVDVNISNNTVYIGDSLQINVSVLNKGTETESFNVGVYFDSCLIENLPVSTLAPGAQVTLISLWNTTFIHEGFYQINVSAPLPGDIHPSDNQFVAGVVQVKTKPVPPFEIHDVAISTVSPYSNLTYIGEVFEIFVIVKNEGNCAESFNVTSFYDSSVVGTLLVENLQPNSKETLVFEWDTKNVAKGNYILSALASQVEGEENLGNNHFIDGVVEVAEAPKGWYLPDWFYLLLLFLLTLLAVLLIAWYYRRKRRKRAEEAFYSGWTAWYYGYDMHKR